MPTRRAYASARFRGSFAILLDAIAARCDADAGVAGKFVNQVLLKERNAGLAEACCICCARKGRPLPRSACCTCWEKGA